MAVGLVGPWLATKHGKITVFRHTCTLSCLSAHLCSITARSSWQQLAVGSAVHSDHNTLAAKLPHIHMLPLTCIR